MGCRVSSNESLQNTTSTMSRNTIDEVDFKSRLERKLCVAKETPEPDYDLSDCNLKEVPSGVFIMCRILLKEELNLSNNKLQNLNNGGLLKDLNTIKILNLNSNKFKKIPINTHSLENLRELHLSNNLIEFIPITIRELKYLEILDLSKNKLTNVEQLSMMPSLRVLNLTENNKLTKLPFALSTCESLIDIILDPENFTYPPFEITQLGTMPILQYLLMNSLEDRHQDDVKELTKRFISNEKREPHPVKAKENKYVSNQALMDHERFTIEKDYMLEAQLHSEQQKKKEILLEQLRQEQNETETMVNNLQKVKQVERDRLITSILQDEEYTNMIVENLLCLKNGPDPYLIEIEKQEEQELLDKLHLYQCDLRKQEIISQMTNFLEQEMNIINSHQEQRTNETRSILEKENEANKYLENIFINYDKDRSQFINEIKQNEELQKSAVAALLVKNDARSWGIIEQVRIVEAQLAKMTMYEIERRKTTSEGAVDELGESRINLTLVLLDLLDQQEQRRLQLFQTLRYIEEQNEEHGKDYWLMQYQKLLDTRPNDISLYSTSIDPLLGYNFLVNGVIHCLPFLSKFWQNETISFEKINEQDLSNAGIKKEADRKNILKSIREYLNQDAKVSVSCTTTPTAPTHQASDDNISVKETTKLLTECVICLDQECQVIFLPCGHLCSCTECQVNLLECPLCRAIIERRIKVIQA